jgi:NagD protein
VRLLDLYEGFVFDLDGTVYLDDQLLPGAAEAIGGVRKAGRSLCYLTNKPLEPSAAYAAKLTGLGLPTSTEEVVSSLDALLTYMRNQVTGSVLCVSEPLVADLLTEAGFRVVSLDDAESADFVVVSFDRTFNYEKLHAAYRAVRAGARIVATNPDRFCPTADGGLPDCAAMLAAVETCTGAKAEAIVGKPSVHMASELLQRLDLPPERVLLIGDRLHTDVAMAHRSGMAAGLALTGDSQAVDLANADDPPDYLLDDLSDLLNPPRPITR